MKRQLLLACMAGAALACGPASAFDAALARKTSDGLTQAQMDKAWDLFEQAQSLARSGDPLASGFAARAAALINPAEPAMHAFAASQFDRAGANGKAWAHWIAVANLYDYGKRSAVAQSEINRLELQMRGREDLISCTMLGHPQMAWAAACDDAVPPKRHGTTHVLNISPPVGMDIRRVSAYSGAQKPQQEVSTIVGTGPTASGPATTICRIDGMRMPAGGVVSVIYILPGAHRLGWCHGDDDATVKGETQIQVSAGNVYQIKGFAGGGHQFSELGYRVKLTWRHFAPDGNDLPNIDGPIPYGSSY